MLKKVKLVLALTLYCGLDPIMALEDGDFYKITNAASGKALTVESNEPVDGAGIIVKNWNNEPNQKWLAVQAGDAYLLLNQQQRWNWNFFLRNGESLRETKDRHNTLPDWSLVLNGNPSGQVTVQPRDSKKYQQWRSEAVTGSKTVIIKNLQENKCLQAPGGSSSKGFTDASGTTTPTPVTTKKPGVFRRIGNWFRGLFGGTNNDIMATPIQNTISRNSISSGTNSKVILAVCDKNNAFQQWALELVSVR